MKKSFLYLMIACLSLFVAPGVINAGNVSAVTETVTPVLPPAVEKKVDKFKKNHPDMFTKKENKESNSASSERHGGGVYYISGTALVLIIILLIILL